MNQLDELKKNIELLWDNQGGEVVYIQTALEMLDNGRARVAEKCNGQWHINQYLKKAILLFFKHNQSCVVENDLCSYYDKVPLKTQKWAESDFQNAEFRLVPGAIVRFSAYIAKSSVIMPSFINVGAYIGSGTMIDTHTTIGSCAQIGDICHISDGVTIGGVLEPLQANPVIIEDNCFVGARSSITEGVIIGEGSVIGQGVALNKSTKIINVETKEVITGYVPPYSVVVPGMYEKHGMFIACSYIIKKVNEQTRAKTSVNELLRGNNE